MSNRLVNPDPQFFDNSGEPLSGGVLRTYLTTTSTPAPTYSDPALTISNGTYIVLDSAGRSSVSIFLDPAVTLKVTLETSTGIVLWTRDPVVDLAANILASVQVYAGNPNSHIAGNAGTPGSSGASMVFDITNQILYIATTTGNASTTVWTALSSGITGGEDIYTSTQTITVSNAGRVATANSATAITFNLTASATIGAGKLFGFKNIGAGVLTVDPAGAELIEGLSSIQLTANEGVLAYCTGGTWRILCKYDTMEVAEATVADSATPAIGAANSLNVVAAGTTTVTGFDTVAAGIRRTVRWASARTLTYSANLLLLGAQTRAVTADDVSIFRSEGGGIWRELDTARSNTYPLISPPGFRNIARRNGGLEVWQRGAGGAASIAVAASTTAYTADGWYLATAANQASVVSQQAGITNGSQWCAKVQRNNGQTGTGLMQWGFPLDTDELYSFLGQFVRLSLTLKAGTNWSPTSGILGITFVVGTGTPVKAVAGYTAAANVINTNQAITTSAVRYQFGSAAVVPITARQAEIYFSWTPVGTAGADDSFSIDDVQLESVPDVSQQASPFEYQNFQETLALCQRHFQKTFLYGTAPVQNAAISTGEASGIAGKAGAVQIFPFNHRFSPPMRVAPTLTYYNPAAANAQIRDEIAAADTTATTTQYVTANNFLISCTGAAGTAVGNVMGVHFIADSGI